MNNKRNRRIAMVVAVLMLTIAFSTTGFAAWMGKTIDVSYRNISIWVNGEMKQARDANGVVVEPFIYNGTTYVPIRGISQMLGYDVSFDQTNYRIDIKGDATDSALQYQLYLKDARIAELEAQLANKSGDLSVIEKDLLKEFGSIGKVYVEDITLKGDKDDIEVGIFVDLYYDQDDWDDLRDRDIENYLQDIVDELLKEFKDADITGYIEDEDSKKELVEFSIDKNDDVVLGKSSSGSISKISDLQADLNKEFNRVYGLYLDFIVDEEKNGDLWIDIYVERGGEIADLKDSEITDLLEDVCFHIEDVWDEVDMDGVFWDEKTEIDFELYRGKLTWK
jgi:hypothetical protein